MQAFLQHTVDGLLQAGPYALVGLGITLGFGTLRRINLAYGAGAMLAAYVGAWLHARYLVPAWVVVALVVVLAAVIGLYVEWMCFPRSRGFDPSAVRGVRLTPEADGREVVALAATFAIWMQLEQLAVALLPNHLNPFPSWAAATEWQLGGIGIRPDRLVQLLLALGFIALLSLWLRQSRAGLAWRAVANQVMAAHLAGVAVAKVQRIAFMATSALAGLVACMVLVVDGQVTPMFGMWMLVKGLVAAMLGGLGSVRGVMAGAIVLGLVEAYAQALGGALARDASAWTLLLLVLVWRGTMPWRRESAHA